MMFLKCASMSGQCGIKDGPLRVRPWRDVTFDHWALYDREGRIIEDSAYFRAYPHYEPLGGPRFIDPEKRIAVADAGDYFWLGRYFNHFGHFIVASLARLWAWDRDANRDAKLVYTGFLDPEALFRIDYVRLCLEAVGVRREQLVYVTSATRFPSMTIAEPSFVENFHVSPVYFDMMRRIATEFWPAGRPQGQKRSRVYLSRSRLKSGSNAVSNEDEFEALLERDGVEIAHPEQMSFMDQLQLMSDAACTIGFSGSAFHTSVFFGGRRSCVISQIALASSNHVLIDRIAGNQGLFIYPSEGLDTVRDKTPGFDDAATIRDPVWMSREILRIVDRFERGKIGPQSVPMNNRPAWGRKPAVSGFGRDLLRSGIVEVSEQADRSRQWRIEFADYVLVNEIVIPIETEVAALSEIDAPIVSVLVSGNGKEWFDLSQENPAQPVKFGEAGTALVWQNLSVALALFVRIDLRPDLKIALDGIRMIGEPASVGIGLPPGVKPRKPPRLAVFAVRRLISDLRRAAASETGAASKP